MTKTRRRLSKVKRPPDWWGHVHYPSNPTAEDWLRILTRRLATKMQIAHQTGDDAARIFKLLILEDRAPLEVESRRLLWEPTLGVRDLSVAEAFFLCTQNDKHKVAREEISRARAMDGGRHIWWSVVSAMSSPAAIDAVAQEIFDYVLQGRMPTVVDLTLDDRTLKANFADWLRSVRKKGHRVARPFGRGTFTQWKKHGVIPAFDLLWWADLAGERLTDDWIGKTLATRLGWAHKNPREMYRKVTKPLVATIFSPQTLFRLQRQIEMEHKMNQE